MMKWEVTEDARWIRLTEYDDELDLRQVKVSFTREVANIHFVKKKSQRLKGWDGKVEFLKNDRFLPVGLWAELIKLNEKFGLGITLNGIDRVIDMSASYKDFKEWVYEFFPGGMVNNNPDKIIREYQIEAAFKIIKFKLSSQELATNAGKTLITFMAVAYMMQRGLIKRFLMIVPNTNLVIQGVEDFQEYGAHKLGMIFQQVHGESKEIRSDANVVMGTYQSLVKKDGEYLANFEAVFVDEAHSAPAVSIRKIVAQCAGSIYRFGLSGTLTSSGVESADYYTIQMCLGPMVNKISPDFLIQNNFATPVDIKIVRMRYLPDETMKKLHDLRKNKLEYEGSDIYQIEKKLVVQSRLRLNFVVDTILKATKNSLVLFNTVEDGYGRAIFDLIREKSADKEVFYVDGDTKNDMRELYKAKMKEGENRILVASFGTFSTGISINNLHNIYLVESYKSENIIKQTIGRGLRLHEDKDKVNIIDFVDDFSWGNKKNYLMEHSMERIKIYEKEMFPYKIYSVDLTKLT